MMSLTATCACSCRCGNRVPAGQVMCTLCAHGMCPTDD